LRVLLCIRFNSSLGVAGHMEEVMLRNLAFVIGCARSWFFSLGPQFPQLNSALQKKLRPCLREQFPR
jgi:hypothetical protein